MRRVVLGVIIVICSTTALAAAPSRMKLDDISQSSDSIADRDRQRIAEARWFIVGVDDETIVMVDRETLRRHGAARSGWTMAVRFAGGNVTMRAATNQTWNCTARSNTVMTMQTYDGKGRPDPMLNGPGRREPIIPGTLGEDAFKFVCDRSANGNELPMPVSRDPISAAKILAAYANGSEVTILGLLLSTLDPWKDEERLQSLLELEKPDKRAKLTQLIWGGLR